MSGRFVHGLGKQVNLAARLNPPREGLTVHFKVFDVDDPFDQLNTAMADVSLIDNDASGPDNRLPGGGADPAVGTYSAVTDAGGEARITLTVSIQPGNNYRAAASCAQAAILQAGQALADAQNLQLGGGAWSGTDQALAWSPMLTVWRKLHVERDTMAAPDPIDLHAVGSVTSVQLNTPSTGLSRLFLQDKINFEGDLNNYEEGLIILATCPSGQDIFPAVESGLDAYTKNGRFLVDVVGLPGSCAVGSTFTLQDDDDLSVLGTPSNPRYPDGGTLLFDAFKPAYILPQYAVEHETVVPFDKYLDFLQVEHGLGSWDDSRVLFSSGDYWASFLVGAWEGAGGLEGGADSDGDPDFCFTLLNPPLPRDGAETAATGITDADSGRAAIFFQAIADDAACLWETDEAHTVVHEIGHTCGNLVHKPNTIMEIGAPKNQNAFDSEQLNILRNQDPW